MLNAVAYDKLLQLILDGHGLIHSYCYKSDQLHMSHVILRPSSGIIGLLEIHGVIQQGGTLIARITQEPIDSAYGRPEFSRLEYGTFSIEVVKLDEIETIRDVVERLQESFPDRIQVSHNGKQG